MKIRNADFATMDAKSDGKPSEAAVVLVARVFLAATNLRFSERR